MRHRTILAVLLVGILAMTLTSAMGKPPAKPKTSEQELREFDEIVEFMDDPLRSGLFAVHQIKEMAVQSKEFEAGIDALELVATGAAEPPVRRAALFVLAELQKELGHVPEAMNALARSCTAPKRPGCRCPNYGCPNAPAAGGAVKAANVEVVIANPFEADAPPVKSAVVSGRGKIVIMGPDGEAHVREFDIPVGRIGVDVERALRFEHPTDGNGDGNDDDGKGEKRDREARERRERDQHERDQHEREMDARRELDEQHREEGEHRERDQHEREMNARRELEEQHREREIIERHRREREQQERERHEREMQERRRREEGEHREREEMRRRQAEAQRALGDIHKQVEQRFQRIGQALGKNRGDIDRLARMTQELAGALRRLHHEQQEQAEEMEEFIDDLTERFMDDDEDDEDEDDD